MPPGNQARRAPASDSEISLVRHPEPMIRRNQRDAKLEDAHGIDTESSDPRRKPEQRDKTP